MCALSQSVNPFKIPRDWRSIPLTKKSQAISRYPGQDEQQSNLLFQAKQEIGQEESASSLILIASYDILLEWIDPANRFLHISETRVRAIYMKI
jgi:hypothetical protein